MGKSVNNKCKAFTSLKQSRELAKILSNETADMYYAYDIPYAIPYKNGIGTEEPCWTLAALITILPASCDDGQHCFALINSNPNGDTEWLCCYEDCNGNVLNECYADNPIDACYEMIIKLHEQELYDYGLQRKI